MTTRTLSADTIRVGGPIIKGHAADPRVYPGLEAELNSFCFQLNTTSWFQKIDPSSTGWALLDVLPLPEAMLVEIYDVLTEIRDLLREIAC